MTRKVTLELPPWMNERSLYNSRLPSAGIFRLANGAMWGLFRRALSAWHGLREAGRMAREHHARGHRYVERLQRAAPHDARGDLSEPRDHWSSCQREGRRDSGCRATSFRL